MIETIGEEDTYYVKKVESDVLSQSPFNMPDRYIDSDIETSVFYGRGDIGISVTKIWDLQRIKM